MKEDFTPASYWADQWESFRGINTNLIGNPASEISGMNLPRREWTLLNRFRTGVGRCKYWKFKWGQADSQSCYCGEDQQTMNHIVNDCPLRCLSGGIDSLNTVGHEAICWLKELDVSL
uniref:Reverse transcriptase zinc-binding domain-containing protein n=1 Tax=Cuerna arida TaxID=1464854 RepID=A0A1B6GY26_9HEMI